LSDASHSRRTGAAVAALFAFAECDEEHCVNPFDLFNLYVQGLCVLDENAAADIRSIISGLMRPGSEWLGENNST
jgi:hypothetical protein